MNTKLHALADANGRPLSFFMTAGQVSDYTSAAGLLDDVLKAQWRLGDRSYDADWSREALQAKGTSPASREANRATSLSGTTSAAIGAAAASKTGGASLPVTTAVRPPSSQL